MPPSAMRTIDIAPERRAFDCAYLFYGDDEFLKEEKVRSLIASATDAGTRDFNLDVRRGSETDAPSLVLAFDALPMMATRRVLVLRDVTALKKDARAVLDHYLDRPSVDTVLLLTVVAGAKVEDRLVSRTTAVEFAPLNDDELSTWVLHKVTALGGSITPTAVSLLCSATGNDLPLLTGEIDKLISFVSGAQIDESAVSSIVGVREGETLGDLLNCVAVRDALGAVALLEHLLAQPKTTGVSVTMALTTQALAVGWGLSARDHGLPQHRLESELFGLLKENPSSVVGRPWGEGVRCWVRAMRHWDEEAVDQALNHLLAADAALKDTRLSSDQQVLTSLILTLAQSARRRPAT